jgi:hypothetical protein
VPRYRKAWGASKRKSADLSKTQAARIDVKKTKTSGALGTAVIIRPQQPAVAGPVGDELRISVADARNLVQSVAAEAASRAAAQAASSAAAQVGAMWAIATSGAERLAAEAAGVLITLIYTNRRENEDRPQRATVESWQAALPFVPIHSLSGFDGVGNCKPGEKRTVDTESANKKALLSEFGGAIAKGGFKDGGFLPDPVWVLTRQEFESATSTWPGTSTFRTEEETHYTTAATAGMLGCSASHIYAIMRFCGRLRNPLEASRMLLVCENDWVPVNSKTFAEHFRQTLALLREVQHWDVVLFWRGGDAPTGRKDEADETCVVGLNKQSRLYVASFVAGQACYLVSESGAQKLSSSGFHKELFCIDDFLNAVNANRVGSHINRRVQARDCVRNVLASGGGLTVLVSKYFRGNAVGSTSQLKQTDAARKSDTRYEVIKTDPET